MNFNLFHILFGLATSILLITFCLKNKNISQTKKIYFLLSYAGIIVYSGISTVYVESAKAYFGHFLIFLVAFYIGFVSGGKIKFRGTRIILNSKTTDNEYHHSKTEFIPDTLLICFLILFFAYYFVQLVYPTNRLSNLLGFRLLLTGIFERREAARSNGLYQVFYYLNMLTMVFVFIYLNRLRNRKKTLLLVGIFLTWIYLKTVVLGYIGRYEIITVAFMVITLIACKDSQVIRLNKKIISIFVVIFIAMIPFLLAYESFRLGRSFQVGNFGGSIRALFESETGYGKYYDECINMSSGNNLLNYLAWVASLPLPSAIFRFKNKLQLVNVYFSERVLNVMYGTRGYYVVLPSLLGEAFILYGRYFFWLHALLLGFFINIFSSLMEKNYELEIVNFYFAVSCLALGRGGTGSVLPSMINCMVFYLISLGILRIKRSRVKKPIS